MRYFEWSKKLNTMKEEAKEILGMTEQLVYEVNDLRKNIIMLRSLSLLNKVV